MNMKILRYLTLVFLAALLGLGGVSGYFGVGGGTLAQAQGQAECTVTVQLGESIQAAIDEAEEGEVICLGEGEWRENVTIMKSVTLRGQGPELSVIRAKDEGKPVVEIGLPGATAVEVVIEGIKVTGAFDWIIFKELHGILVTGNSQVTIADSTISGNDESGIKLRNNAQVTITSSTVSGNGWDGIELVDNARITITDSAILENDMDGITLFERAQATIISSTVSGNKGGINLFDSTKATIKENQIKGNRYYGIMSWSSGEVRGSGNVMHGNGVDLVGNLPGTLRVPLVEAAEQEIVFPDKHFPTLQHAVDALFPGGRLILRKGEYEAGITVAKELAIIAEESSEVILKARSDYAPVLSLVGDAKLVAKGLTITGREDGFELGAGAQATIIDFTVSGNRLFGIVLRGNARVTISDSTILGNGHSGIKLLDSAQAIITSSMVSQNKESGIWLLDNAQAAIADSTLSGNDDGIELRGSAQATITGSTLSENGSGARLFDSAQATISNSILSRNYFWSIDLWDNTQVTISHSTLSENGSGIELRDSAQAKIEGSTLSRNDCGIELEDNARITITRSIVLGNQWCGISLGDSVQATISNSDIFENRHGIVLEGSAQATIEGNTIINNRGYGVALYQRPCYDTDKVFEGHISGKRNTIPGPGEPGGNGEGAVCPSELDFLMTEEGGCYGSSCE